MRYRKKPVVIEAFKWMTDEVPGWWKDAEGIEIDIPTGSVFIPTLEGTHEAKRGDFIIQGVQGELYPCKPDIFEATYEKVIESDALEVLYNMGFREMKPPNPLLCQI